MTPPTAPVRERALSLPSEDLPAYLYDLSALREHAAVVRAALPERVELYYAAKANPEPDVLAALGPYVDGYEVSSGGELAHVSKAVPGRQLAFRRRRMSCRVESRRRVWGRATVWCSASRARTRGTSPTTISSCTPGRASTS
jgi:hypothetical protein